jgi:putative two-component system response regulator
VDVYDALVSERVYKKGMPHDKAIEIIKSESGTHFDSEIVDSMLEIEDKVRSIYSSTEADGQGG